MIMTNLSDCGILSLPENAIINHTAGIFGNNTLFASATYDCEIGFILIPPETRTCTETSEWLPAAPNCTLSKVSFV